MIYENILDTIGNTPIVRLRNIGNKNIYVKLENYNPGFSIKDRAVYNMINELEKEGKLKKESILVEASSGNAGISLSMIGNIKGYKVIIIMPENMSKERIDIIKCYGSHIILTDKKLGMKGAIKKVKELVDENLNYVSLNQFENENNKDAHYKTTAVEIFKDISDIDIFVCGVGTGATLSGVGKYLKEKNKDIRIVAVEPQNSPTISQGKNGIHKIQGIGAGFIPRNYNANIVDEVITISDENAYNGVRIMAKEESILVGISSGANIYASLELSKRYPEKKILTISPDGIDKYMSLNIFN